MARADSDLWVRVSPYLDRALELDPSELEPWLAAFDTAHPELAAELRELLALHAANRASGFMERAPLGTDDSLAGERIGPYTVERLLGRGGMGSVWLGRRSDGKFEGLAAIKLLDRRRLGHDAINQIRNEASLLARLSHPNIARLFDAGVRENGQPYLILEYVEGERIDHYCSARKLPLQERLQLFLTVLEAVAHAHSQLIVHCDLKPSNVLVTADGSVKLLDFGVASLQPQKLEQLQRVPAVGDRQALTPGYAAPEQIRGEPLSTAADVYSLGVLLHVLITGTHPYGSTDSTLTQLARATLTGDALPASERLADAADRRRVRGDLDAVIARALERDPARRYATATEFADDVRSYLGNCPVRARPYTRAYVAHKFAQRHWGGILTALLTVLVLIGATVVTTLQMLEARRQRDFAGAQFVRAEALNDLNSYVLGEAAPGQSFTIEELLGRAVHVLEKERVDETNRIAQLTSIGFEYEMQGSHTAALQVLSEAYRLSRNVSDPSTRARAACALANSIANDRFTNQSTELIEQGLRELPHGAEFAMDRYFCLSRGHQVAHDAGDAQLSIRRSEAALEALRAAPFHHELMDAYAHEELASALRLAGRYREANEAFANAWPRLVALGRDDTHGASTLLSNWSLVLYQLGRPLEAEKLLRRSLELERADAAKRPSDPMLLTNYAQMLYELGRFEDAAKNAESAYARALQRGDQIAINQTQLRLARIYRAQHNPARATAMLDEAERSMHTLLPPGHFAFGALNAERALVARDEGAVASALQFINRAIEIDERAAHDGKAGSQFVPILLTHRASIENDAGNLGAAEEDARRALSALQAQAGPGEYSSYIGAAYLVLARTLSAEGRSAESRAAAHLAAKQLTQAVGSDHADTRAAEALSTESAGGKAT